MKRALFVVSKGSKKLKRAIQMVFLYIYSKIRSFLKYRGMVQELSVLDDRSLSDIGVSRSEIMRIARATSGTGF